MIIHRHLPPAVLVCTVAFTASSIADVPLFDRGHAKGRWQTSTYPNDSLLHDALGDVANDQGAELRLNLRAGDQDPWSVQADYQLLGRFGDTQDIARQLPGLLLVPNTLPDDERRWWDLTHTISDQNDREVVQRLDRLHLDYTRDQAVVRFGRQAVTWGNGLIYNPMDFLNPFDPAAVDTEYKLGDDMLYGQYLLDSGSDVQFVSVARRDFDGDVSADVSSTALKFHGFGLNREFDLLVARHFDETVLAGGGVTNLGEAVVRADLVLTDTPNEWITSLVVNWSYSWVWGGKNVSAISEYYYNGFGLSGSDYSLEDLAGDPDLTQRIMRGELFTLGRHYLAGSIQVEWTPLVNLTPNVFINLADQSALAQVVLQWDVGQNWQILGSINVPIGPDGTEFGGLKLDEGMFEGRTLAADPSGIVQLAYYF
ncbi:MAG: hypothetical protein ABJ013_13315 [Halioglobus sp.]